MKSVVIYTDGSCVQNPGGAGGWSAILQYGDTVRSFSEHIPAPTTNNRAEWGAIIKALEILKEPCEVTLYTDSLNCAYALLGRGKALHKRGNFDLASRAIAAARRHKLTVHWVQGHNGDALNEECDRLARDAARSGAGSIVKSDFSIQPDRQDSLALA